MTLKLDIIGDIHGHHDALVELGDELGYNTSQDWTHPDGRILVFLGDLVDRGPKSLDVAKLVMGLAAKRRAMCLMGNHEYNLVRWKHEQSGPKHSNCATIADIKARPEPWAPVLAWFEQLPLAVELPELRIIHAVWHADCFAQVRPMLAGSSQGAMHDDALAMIAEHVVLGSPFQGGALHPYLPAEQVRPGTDRPHEILIKGYESSTSTPFEDRDGKQRSEVRVTWWSDSAAPVPRDRRTVFGHYWNVPPSATSKHAAPPHPSGHPKLLDWQRAQAAQVPQRGQMSLPPDITDICVDYNGVLNADAGSCVGAYRWPEHQVAWARSTT